MKYKPLRFRRRLINTADRIQASRIANIRQTLRYHPDQEILVISQIQIAPGMCRQLGLTASLSCQETEGDHFPLL